MQSKGFYIKLLGRQHLAIRCQWISRRTNEGYSRSSCSQWLWPGFSTGDNSIYIDFNLWFFLFIEFFICKWPVCIIFLGDFWARRSNKHGRADKNRLSPFLRCVWNVCFKALNMMFHMTEISVTPKYIARAMLAS